MPPRKRSQCAAGHFAPNEANVKIGNLKPRSRWQLGRRRLRAPCPEGVSEGGQGRAERVGLGPFGSRMMIAYLPGRKG